MKAKKDSYFVTVPSWRSTKDITIAEDVVEEVARFYGFNNIISTLPSMPIIPPIKNNLRNLERTVGEILVKGLNYSEVYNYSFVSEAQVVKMGDDLAKYLELDNPLSKERPFLRRNLLPNLLENVKNNIENYSDVKIFEIGKVFSIEESGARVDSNGNSLLPKQDTWLAVVSAAKKDNTPYWQVRRALENIFLEFKIKFETVSADKTQPWEHAARLALVSAFGKTVGIICEMNPITSQNLGIEQRVGVLQLNLTVLSELLEKQKSKSSYHPASEYPAVMRDLAFLVKKDVEHAKISSLLLKVDPLLTKVELFDIYEGTNIGEGYKSMAYTLTIADPTRTMTTVEVDAVIQKVKNILEKEFGAQLR